MSGSIYRKYLWLVSVLRRSSNGLSFEEIDDMWRKSSLSEGVPLSKRTFRNWITAIGDTLGIYIVCRQSAPYLYSIGNSSATQDDLMDWALNAFSIGQILSESNSIKDRILLEQIPSADWRLETILSAMRNGHRIKLDYQPFGRNALSLLTEPYAVKLSRNRWYVVCHSLKNGREYIYGLDRITRVVETEEKFQVRSDYSAEREFEGCIGISALQDVPIADVRLRITGYLRDYIETLPIHHSQRLVERTADSATYSYRLRPDYELVNTILGMGNCCEVLQPADLRKKIHDCAMDMVRMNDQNQE